MEYVKLTREYIAQLAAIETLCFSTPWSENAFLSELNNPLSCWIIALDGKTVAGYVGSQTVLGEADMMNLAVLPVYRRQGMGKRLVEALIEELRSNGVHCLTLEVRASNTPALGLYEKLGFVSVGRRPHYYTKPQEDALILRKEWKV